MVTFIGQCVKLAKEKTDDCDQTEGGLKLLDALMVRGPHNFWIRNGVGREIGVNVSFVSGFNLGHHLR